MEDWEQWLRLALRMLSLATKFATWLESRLRNPPLVVLTGTASGGPGSARATLAVVPMG